MGHLFQKHLFVVPFLHLVEKGFQVLVFGGAKYKSPDRQVACHVDLVLFLLATCPVERVLHFDVLVGRQAFHLQVAWQLDVHIVNFAAGILKVDRVRVFSVSKHRRPVELKYVCRQQYALSARHEHRRRNLELSHQRGLNRLPLRRLGQGNLGVRRQPTLDLVFQDLVPSNLIRFGGLNSSGQRLLSKESNRQRSFHLALFVQLQAGNSLDNSLHVVRRRSLRDLRASARQLLDPTRSCIFPINQAVGTELRTGIEEHVFPIDLHDGHEGVQLIEAEVSFLEYILTSVADIHRIRRNSGRPYHRNKQQCHLLPVARPLPEHIFHSSIVLHAQDYLLLLRAVRLKAEIVECREVGVDLFHFLLWRIAGGHNPRNRLRDAVFLAQKFLHVRVPVFALFFPILIGIAQPLVVKANVVLILLRRRHVLLLDERRHVREIKFIVVPGAVSYTHLRA